MYPDFISFVAAEILPRLAANPRHQRIDGKDNGGNREVIGQFQYQGSSWKVHADTHYEPLFLAFFAAQNDQHPFLVEETTTTHCLVLTPELRDKYGCNAKHLYIYAT